MISKHERESSNKIYRQAHFSNASGFISVHRTYNDNICKKYVHSHDPHFCTHFLTVTFFGDISQLPCN